MKYDPSRRALYTPEKDDPIGDFDSNWELDQICAELSRLCYYRFDENDGARLTAAIASAGFAAPEFFNDPAYDAQAFATVAPDGTAFVVFRGTQAGKPGDLEADAKIRLLPWEGAGRVHQGFHETFQCLRDKIDTWLAPRASVRLVATGHSLGAAMATVMAAVHAQAELVTFGSPRVGDRAFAEGFAGRAVRRYVDCTDMVTRVPPEFLGYAHVGPRLYIDGFGQVHPSYADAEVARDRRRAYLIYALKYAWQVWRNVLVRRLADHAPINYVSAVLGRREGT